jgi:NAD(P)H-quinone oxidoreductase subunit 5
MLNIDYLVTSLGIVVVAAPLVLVFVVGVSSLLDRQLTEQTTTAVLQAGTVAGLLAALAVLLVMLIQGTRHIPIELGDWVVIPGQYHFSIKFVFDRLSVPMAILSFTLSGTIGAFASRYMHRDVGYNRFFVLYTLFVLGMITASLAGTIETLFAGWELVGLSSALLVVFFHERRNPARNGLWVWTIYRFSDAALLLAAVAMHHLRGEGDFDRLLGTGLWPEIIPTLTTDQALIVGLLVLVAAAGKSALVPFSGWLPRAMEGPTPSSAIFYGALSVHLGAFLLLRVSPLLDSSSLLSAVVALVGMTTALFAYLAGSVQTDIKSALSFASLSQVGIIVTEIGLGFRYVALIHILGHACLRTLQFVRAPTLLHDYHLMENALGGQLPRSAGVWARSSHSFRDWLYRFALERGYLDALLSDYVATPFVQVFAWFDAIERRWTDFLTGNASREEKDPKHHFTSIEEFS